MATANHIDALQSTEAGARLLFERAVQGILSIDRTGRIRDANPAALQMFGYAREGLIGESVEMLVPAALRGGHYQMRTEYERRPRDRAMGIGMSLVGMRRDGTEFPAEISLNHLSESGGTTVAFVIDITQRRKAETEREDLISKLEGAVAEKTVLLKEVNHRVKNNLAVIGALLGMQADELADDDASAALTECQQRVMSMALVQEYLYSDDHLDRINFGKYATQLADQVGEGWAAGRARVSLSIEADPIELPVNRAIPCGLILNELISNAFKHAFPGDRHGTISVRFTPLDSGQLSLVCSDDGVGVAEGFDWQNATSLGLRIVQILSRQIGATFTLDRTKPGTCFELTFSAQDS
jgi:two-component system, sensor histidine kinase PdtaS